MLGNLAINYFFRNHTRCSDTRKTRVKLCCSLTFLALLVNDFRKFINVIVIAVSGLVATLGYSYIPFKAYAIVAGLTGLLAAMILTRTVKKNE